MSPECLIPPSEMRGTSYRLAAVAQARMAVICGTPTPATTRVVQIEPGPIPTLIASAPALIRSSAASAVTMFPATTSVPEYRRLMLRTISRTLSEWPCAVSTTSTSAPALISMGTRSSASGPTPTAAPTRSRPRTSLQAFGNLIRFSMSLIVIRPFR